MSALENANDQIRAARARQAARDEARRRAQLPVRGIDTLLSALEELHLEGRKRVPESFDSRLEELNELLPPELRRALRSRITIAHLMDELYEIQHALLGGNARSLDDDADEDWSQAS
ncbi:MAG: hypothetical protein ABR541_05240 [Candidatus Dormibacteria bacterium]